SVPQGDIVQGEREGPPPDSLAQPFASIRTIARHTLCFPFRLLRKGRTHVAGRRTFKYLRVPMQARMGRPFREALTSTTVALAIVPPGRRVSKKAMNDFVARVLFSVRFLKSI